MLALRVARFEPGASLPRPRRRPPEAEAPLLIDADAVGASPVALSGVFFLSPSGYSGDLPCAGKGAAIKSHNDEDQSPLQCGTLGVRQERYGEAELR